MSREFGLKVVVNLFRYIFLQPDQIADFPVVLLSPYFRTVAHVYQVGLNGQSLAALRDLSQEHGIHFQVLSGLLRAHIVALVAENGAARHHPQLRNTRETADDSVGYAVGEC